MLNIKKTNFILFHGGNKKVDNLGLEILIDNVKVNQVDHTKLLGVVINSRLNWNEHIKTVCSKMSKSTSILHRTRKKLNADTLLLLYQTLIQPYFDNCDIIWSGGKSVLLEKLSVKQKKGIRAITFAKWNAHTDRLFLILRLLKLGYQCIPNNFVLSINLDMVCCLCNSVIYLY